MKHLFASLMLLSPLAANAQKIDFDLSGKESTSTEEGFTSWAVGRVKSVTRDFDGVTVKVEAAPGTAANGIVNNWWKDGVNKYSKLVSDGIYAAYIDEKNDYSYSASEAMGIQFTITGLKAGKHTLTAYHNNTDGLTDPYPTLRILVNGKEVAVSISQTIRSQSTEASSVSYIEFDAEDGKDVTIQYISEPKAGEKYSNSSAVVNALIFDRPHPKNSASLPIPGNLDYHADCDDGSVTLKWTKGASAVKHHVFIGEAEDNMKEVAVTSETSYKLSSISTLSTYYWKVIEEDSEGHTFDGDTYSFRPRHLAFPGAEGYGRFAIGGRGGTVYHVTSLDDDATNPAEGTFRYGITKLTGPRTIVFDVSGYITLKDRLTCSDPYVTIAGQTAPGEGITFRGAPLGFASDGITRFIRSYRGYAGNEAGPSADEQNKGLDGLGMAGCDNAIMDHCSVAWTTDEAFSSRNAHSITLQRTLISEALNQADHPNYEVGKTHGYAATIGGGCTFGHSSYHHNLLAHCEGRNWSLSGGLDGAGNYSGAHDVFNNVVYNWGSRATDGGTHELNFVNNFYKMGASTTQKLLLRHEFEGTGNGSQAAYVSGNIRQNLDGSKTYDAENATYEYKLSGGQKLTWEPWASKPFFESFATIESAEAAYANVLSDVGCNQPFFNAHDRRMVSETFSGTTSTIGSKTGKKGLIDREWDAESFTPITETRRPTDFDTDLDGMPDWWENLHSNLNPAVADNNSDADGDGYTALEDYLNWMAQPHFDICLSSTTGINLHDYFSGYPTSGTSYNILGDATMAQIIDGKLSISAPSAEGITTVKVKAEANGISLTREFNFHFTSSATGINEITGNTRPATDNAIYNLSGQRVNSNFRGMIIKNGKKRAQ